MPNDLCGGDFGTHRTDEKYCGRPPRPSKNTSPRAATRRWSRLSPALRRTCWTPSPSRTCAVGAELAPHRSEVGLYRRGRGDPALHRCERRRGRAGEPEGPGGDGERTTPNSWKASSRGLRRRRFRGDLYVNSTYTKATEQLRKRDPASDGRGLWLGKLAMSVRIHPAPQEYVAGEDTASLEVIEGRKPLPRVKPPFPGQQGPFRVPDRREQC